MKICDQGPFSNCRLPQRFVNHHQLMLRALLWALTFLAALPYAYANNSGCPEGYTSAMCAQAQEMNEARQETNQQLQTIAPQVFSGQNGSNQRQQKVYSSPAEMSSALNERATSSDSRNSQPPSAFNSSNNTSSNTDGDYWAIPQNSPPSNSLGNAGSQSGSSDNSSTDDSDSTQDWQNIYF